MIYKKRFLCSWFRIVCLWSILVSPSTKSSEFFFKGFPNLTHILQWNKAVCPRVGRMGKEVRHQAGTLGHKALECVQASEMEKWQTSWAAVVGALPGTSFMNKKLPNLLGSPLVPQAGILQVSQEARNSILQRKGDCHYSVLPATTLDSQDVAKVKEDALGNNKYDNRAPGKISTECWHWWWKR